MNQNKNRNLETSNDDFTLETVTPRINDSQESDEFPLADYHATRSGSFKQSVLKSYQQINKQCGPFQFLIYLITLCPNFVCGIILISVAIILSTPDIRCKLNCDDDNSTYFKPSAQSPNHYPWNQFFNRPVSCLQYETTSENTIIYDNSCYEAVDKTTVVPCEDGYVFDLERVPIPAMGELHMFCHNGWRRSVASSMYMVGMLIASLICGYTSDNYGRTSSYYWAPSLMMISIMIMITTKNYVYFCASLMLVSMAGYGISMADFVLGLENSSRAYRIVAGNGYPIAGAFGSATAVGFFVHSENWRVALLWISLLSSSLLVLPLILPESIKWDVDQGDEYHRRRAIRDIEMALKLNKAQLRPTESESVKTFVERLRIKTIFTDPLVRRWTIIMFATWFIVSFIYYGTIFSASGLIRMNFYKSYIWLSLIEVPFLLGVIVCCMFAGRRTIICVMMTCTGISALIGFFVDNEAASAVFVMLTKGFSTAGFSIISIYSAEIFPTSVRSVLLGFCSVFARFGSILAPIISSYLSNYAFFGSKGILAVSGVLGIISGVLCMFIPETKDKELPESLKDMYHLAKKKIPSEVPDEDEKPSAPMQANASPIPAPVHPHGPAPTGGPIDPKTSPIKQLLVPNPPSSPIVPFISDPSLKLSKKQPKSDEEKSEFLSSVVDPTVVALPPPKSISKSPPKSPPQSQP